MPTLIFRGADGTEQKVELAKELSVGREAGNDVVLAGSTGVSRKHCRFFLDGVKVLVEDLGSANGTLVDGKKVQEPTAVTGAAQVTIGDAVASLVVRKPTSIVKRPAAGGAATPGALPAGPAKQRATRMVDAEEVAKRAGGRPQPLQKRGAGGDERPRLSGTSGPWKGQVHDVNKPKVVVGRTAPADVVVDDDSVSRKHAEVFKTGSRVAVRDLGSANGTFVNGERISEAPLSPGDLIRFGVVEFTYSGPGTPREATPRGGSGNPRKKKIMLAAGGGGLLLLLVILAIVSGGTPAGGPARGSGTGHGVEAPEPDDPLKLLGECKALADPENDKLNWAKAAATCAKVTALDPTLTEAKPLEKLAKKELEFGRLLKEAKGKVEVAQEDLALPLLMQIETASTVFRNAKIEFANAADRIEKRVDTDCRSDIRSGNWSSAFENCKRKLEILCNQDRKIDKDSQARFEAAARSTGRKAEYKCPPEYARFFGKILEGIGEKDTTLADIAAMYSDPTVRKLIISYYQEGRPKDVSRQMKLLRQRERNKYKSSLDSITQRLDIIEGTYTTGQGHITRGEVDQAKKLWTERAFVEDQALLPKGAKSAIYREMVETLADRFFVLAKNDFDRGRYSNSCKNMFQGYELSKANTDLVQYVQNYARQAKDWAESASCEEVKFAADCTLPGDPIHARAEERKAELCPSSPGDSVVP
jgi:pSer/pThr/pTyr-binding forkhead associated (FHA) protein